MNAEEQLARIQQAMRAAAPDETTQQLERINRDLIKAARNGQGPSRGGSMQPSPQSSPPLKAKSGGPEPIAIVGLSGVLPQCPSVRAFWQALDADRSLIETIPENRFDWRTLASADTATPCRWGGFVPNPRAFDPLFFGILPDDAALMDPRLRLLLMSVYQTLEDAGYAPERFKQSRTGVFVALEDNDYAHLLAQQNLTERAPDQNACLLPNHISYHFDFRGPSEAIDTMCSGAAVALHRAVNGLRLGEMDTAVVAAANIILRPEPFIALSRQGHLSPEATVRSFGAEAAGHLRAEGAISLLLKPMARAQADGDHIYALIRNTAVNYNGRGGTSMAAPNPAAHADVIRDCYRGAAIDIRRIGYIEAQGMGNPVADLAEWRAYNRALRDLAKAQGVTLPTGQCRISTLKPMTGHMEAASALGALLKIIRTFHSDTAHRILDLAAAHPDLDQDGAPCRLLRKTEAWPAGPQSRLAGLHAYGTGGNNAHILVEEYRAPVRPPATPSSWYAPLSGSGETSLRNRIHDLHHFLEANPSVRPADLAFTLQTGRTAMEHRAVFVADSRDELIDMLGQYLAGNTAVREQAELPQRWRNAVPGNPSEPGPNLHRLALPVYTFETQDYWLDQVATDTPTGPTQSGSRETQVRDYLIAMLAETLRLPTEKVKRDKHLHDYGIDSLKGTHLIRALEKTFGCRIQGRDLLAHPSINDLAAFVAGQTAEQKTEAAPSQTPKSPLNNAYPLSVNQRGLWLLQKLHPSMTAYNFPLGLRLFHPVKQARFREALQDLVRRHPILGTRFSEAGGELLQTPDPDAVIPFEHKDIASLSDDQVDELLQERSQRPFDLAVGPPLRCHLLQRGPEEWLVLLVLHHIITDGFSIPTLYTTLLDAYRQRLHGETLQANPAPALDFAAYVAEEKNRLAGPDGAALRDWWRKRLPRRWPTLNLPGDQPRHETPSFEGRVHQITLAPALSQALQQFIRAQRINPAPLFLALLKTLLYRTTGQDDVIVGMPARSRPEGFDDTIGYFTNLLPIRLETLAGRTFRHVMQQTQLAVLDALDHEALPFPEIVRDLAAQRGDLNPLCQVLFEYQNFFSKDDLARLQARYPEIPLQFMADRHQLGEAALTLEVVRIEDGFLLNVKYDPTLFTETRIHRLTTQYLRLAASVVADPEQPLEALPLLSPQERRQRDTWNATATTYPKSCVHELFAQQAQRTPAATALICGETERSYDALNRRSDQLAGYLQTLGVQAGTRVAVCIGRSEHVVVAMLAVLKAGGAYVPLDPGFPEKRLTYMLEDSDALMVLTESRHRGKVTELLLTQIPVLALDTEWPLITAANRPVATNKTGSDHLAYIIYTSGSSGRPKGVMIPHRALTNFLCSMASTPGLGEEDRLLAVTTVSFDIAGLELFLPLITGAVCMLCPEGIAADAARLKQEIKRRRPTVMQATPTTWAMLFHAGWRNSEAVRLLCGGEPMPESLRQRFNDTKCAVWNVYGPTETTIWSTLAKVNEAGPIHIGTPLANTEIYILGRKLAEMPAGTPGELCIAGDGLAEGYHNRPDLTADRFVPHPFRAGQRLYRTGDLARRLPDGNLEHLGRMDFQVKVRGYRIEPAEIEARLTQHAGVRECVVVARTDQGGDHLVAWYLAAEQTPDPRDLADHLAADLPAYMVPSLFLALDAFPLTYNGKIDRKTLMERPLVAPTDPEPAVGAPSLEHAVLAHWNAVLPIPVTDTSHGFFELGGDSYRAVVLAERISREFAIGFTTTDLFRHTSVRAMARHIAAVQGETGQVRQSAVHAVEATPRENETPDSLAIIGICGQFPDAENHHTFWENLRNGHDSARFLGPDALREAGVAEALINDPTYVPLQQTIADKYRFDNDFFRISHKNARAMDPQLRRLLQAAWGAVEDAGYVPEALADTGVYISASNSFYQAPLYQGSVDLYDPDAYVAWVLAQPGAFATMIAYQLNLRGPAYAVHANCSSSLVGLHAAWQSLQLGDIRQALVGAASLMPSNKTGYRHRAGLNFAADGRCKAFDAGADGMVGGEGVAMVLLKRTADALADGDHIYALLRGIAVNNDGRDKAGFYAPSIEGQAAVIRQALQRSGVDPGTIDYVEAHGTGTRLGDPIEIAALTEAWGHDQRGTCGIGSVKSNIGHLDTAAGLAGLVKVAMSLYHGEMAPTLHVTNPNPNIDFAASPFYLVDRRQPWPTRVHPRRAALSSFGLGGTNTHAVLEAAPNTTATAPAVGPFLIPLSAADMDRLRAVAAQLRDFLTTTPSDWDVGAAAYTLQVGRQAMPARLALVVADQASLCDRLEAFLTTGQAPDLFIGSAKPETSPIPDPVLHRRDWHALARLWVEGAVIDWSVVWPEPRPRRLSLPTYPFAGDIFDLAPKTTAKPATATPLHPLLHQQSTDDTMCYRSRFSGSEPFLADHHVNRRPVLPGVAYLEMARFAAQHALGTQTLTLRNLVWIRPLAISEGPITVTVRLTSDEPDRYRYTVNSEQAGAGAIRHSQGLIELDKQVETPDSLDPVALQKQISHTRYDAETCYQTFEAFGIQYGPSHRALQWVAADGVQATRVLAKLNLPRLDNAVCLLHPGMLDAAVQASIGFVFGGDETELTLPYALREVALFHPCTGDMWAVLERRGTAHDDPIDITLCDDRGRVCVVMNGLVNRRVAAEAPQPSTDPLLHLKVPVWDAFVPKEKTGAGAATTILIGGNPQQRHQLSARFAELTVTDTDRFHPAGAPTDDASPHFIWIAPEQSTDSEETRLTAAEAGVLQLFRMVKQLLSAGFDARACELTLITTNAVAVFPNQPVDPTFATVHGFAGALAQEFRHWTVRLVDLEKGTPLPQELTRIWPEPSGAGLAHRSVGSRQQWFRQDLLPVQSWNRFGDVALRHGGVYVIIGGAGGIGAAWSRHAAERYAATIYWLGRRPMDDSIRARRDAATVGNLAPFYIQADATDPSALDRALDTIQTQHPRIDGLIQAALVLDDASLTNMDEGRFLSVLKTRVHASVHAAHTFQPQDFLLFLSSMTAFDRAAGQSNYAAGCTFMDSYAPYLAQTPGLLPKSCSVRVINWGFWGNIGAVATPAYRARMEQAGFGSIEPADGFPIMDHLPNAAFSQLAVTKTIDRRPSATGFLQHYPEIIPSLLHKLTPPTPTLLPSPPVAAFETDLRRLLWAVLAPRCKGPIVQPADWVKNDDPTLQRWCAESCRLLAEAGFLAADGAAYRIIKPPATDAWDLWREHQTRWCDDPTLAPQVHLVNFVLEALPAILDGDQRAHEVLFPNASMERVEGVYKNNPVADTFNDILGEALVGWFQQRLLHETCSDCVRAVEASCSRVTPVRILEIGAGTGGTTAGLLTRLQPYTAYLEEYTYTDLSHAFLKHARAQFAPGRPWLTTQIFDAGKPLADQAIEAGSYDVVIATNVLHATGSIRQTLRNAKATLKKNGALFLNEISTQVLFDHLTFGLMDGWWLYQDGALRLPGCPGLAPPTWRDVLAQEGFLNITFPAEAAHHLGQQIVLAESDGTVRQEKPAADPVVTSPVIDLPRTPTTGDGTQEEHLATIIRESLAGALDMPPSRIHDTRTFADLGVDSISAVGIVNQINERCGLLLPTTTLFDYPNLDQLAQYIWTEHQSVLVDATTVEDDPRRAQIRTCLAESLQMPEQGIRDDRPFSEYGVDSIVAVELVNRVNQCFNLLLQTTVLFDHNTVDRLSDYLETVQPQPPQPIPGSGSELAEQSAEAGAYRHLQLRGPGDINDLVLTTSALEPLAADAVRIKVQAFSLNFADLLCVRGLYPNMPPYPFTPGDEAAGIVTKVGAAVTRCQPGDAVVCLTPGCHTEVVTCPQDRVYPKPATLSFDEACSLPMVALTMLNAFRKADLQPGERILIQTAAGGIGLVAVQLAQHAGAEIFATAGSQAKLDYLRDLGVDHVINYRESDFEKAVQDLTHGEGVDVVINTLAGDAVQKGLNLLRAGGRYIEIAMAALKTARSVDLSVLNHNQAFFSIDLGLLRETRPERIRRDWETMNDLITRGVLRPTISRSFPFTAYRDAYQALAQRANIGKVVVHVAATPQPTPPRPTHAPAQSPTTSAPEPIAIIGMSARFAHSPDVATFWQHLAAGKSLVEAVSRWDLGPENGDTPRCRFGSFLADYDQFDAAFFNITEEEAVYMDPQQRLFLEEAWKALEDAGHCGEAVRGSRCSVYVGAIRGDYPQLFTGTPPAHAFWGNEASVIPARISYLLDLHGPAVAVDTACSSSLSAVHYACSDLWSGLSETAVAGGVFIQPTPEFYRASNDAGMLSPSGRCYSFDERADGFVPGEGVGALVLKPLRAALADGDHVHGVILGSGVNQDGGTNGLTAPGARSQERLLRHVYQQFQIDPKQITMVDAHGTGTRLGDAIEFEALTRTFDSDHIGTCALGSVKSNIGHASTASGLSGMVKVLLALRHKQIPPTLNFQSSALPLQDSPFFINTTLRPWSVPADQTRIGAVSSFGFSGTNAHVVLGEAPVVTRRHAPQSAWLVTLSARSRDQLQTRVADLIRHLNDGSNHDLGNISFTLLTGRTHHHHRLACVVGSIGELVQALTTWRDSGGDDRIAVREIPEGRTAPKSLREQGNRIIERCRATTDTAALLSQVRDYYLQGCRLNYSDLFEAGFTKVPLPTYPFARKRFMPDTAPESELKATPAAPEQDETTSLHVLRDWVAQHLNKPIANIDTKLSFFQLGMDSLQLNALAAQIAQQVGRFPTTLFFEYVCLADLAEYLTEQHPEVTLSPAEATRPVHPPTTTHVRDAQSVATDVAVIGISGAFPQAEDLDTFWANILAGRDCITPIPEGRFPSEPATQPSWSGGFLSRIEHFDPLFFGMSPREAKLLDPQQRLLLRHVWQALEDAAVTPEQLRLRPTGIFTALAACDAYEQQARLTESDHAALAVPGAAALPNRIAQFLDVCGPAANVESACASSLLALHHAVQAVQTGSCDQAVAAAAHLMLTPDGFIDNETFGNLSSSGRIHSFQAEADGYVRGEGVGAVLLKRLDLAIADGDRIQAVIKGSGVANGGRAMSLTAPSAKGMRHAVAAALRGCRGATEIDYIEAHGTGTVLGDGIEIAALQAGYRAHGNLSAEPSVYVGCVKPSIGNSEIAAGMAEFLKVVLALRHQILPGIPGFREPHEQIDLAKPFRMTAENKFWPQGRDAAGKTRPRRAGINSYGVSGTNAHLVVEEYPSPSISRPTTTGDQLIVLSAPSKERLRATATQLLTWLKQLEPTQTAQHFLGDLAYTLQVGRQAMAHRLALVVAEPSALLQGLTQWLIGEADQTLFEGGTDATTDPPPTEVKIAATQDPAQLAAHWTHGGAVDWITDRSHGRRIKAPGYAFRTDTYPVQVSATATQAEPPERPAPITEKTPTNWLYDTIAGILDIPLDQLPRRKPLFELGFTSLSALSLKTALEQKTGTVISLAAVDIYASLDELVAQLALPASEPNSKKTAVVPEILPEPAARYQPFPLNDIQESFLLGRNLGLEEDRVGCHIYLELTFAKLDIYRLNQAWQSLIDHHDMLRVVIGNDGTQRVQPQARYRFRVGDFRHHTPSDRTARLAKIRDRMAHQVYQADQWPLFEIRVSLCPEQAVVHFSMDELVVDAAAVDLLFQQWQQRYRDLAAPLPTPEIAFRDYVLALKRFEQTPRYRNDLTFQLERCRRQPLPYGPALPLRAHLEKRGNRFSHLEESLLPETWRALKKHAMQRSVSPSALVLGVFTAVLQAWCGPDPFSLILTRANRETGHPDLPQLVGPFLSTSIHITPTQTTVDQVVRATQTRFIEDLDHGSVGGIRLLRELRRRRLIDKRHFLPVVFTSLLGHPTVPAGTGFRDEIAYFQTQTPQVYLDHQVREQDDRLIVRFDVIKEYFEPGFVDALFHHYCTVLADLAAEDLWDTVVEAPQHAHTGTDQQTPQTRDMTPFPLTDQQQAYAFGRSQYGAGTNTQIYTSYDADVLDVPRLERAWARVLAVHDMLTTRILSDGTAQYLAEAAYAIEVTDLRDLDETARQEALSAVEAEMMERICPLDAWPYFEVRVSRLPRGRRIHLAIDMIIADGPSIDLILNDWFAFYRRPDLFIPPTTYTFRDFMAAQTAFRNSEAFRAGQTYWKTRFAQIPAGPRFPGQPNGAASATERLTATVDGWSTLREAAERLSVTPGMILLTAYADALAAHALQVPFTLVVPCWQRPPLHPAVDEVVGDFTAMSWLVVEPPRGSFEARVRRTHAAVQQDLAHLRVSGLGALRRVSAKRDIAFPVVFTDLSIHPGPDLPDGFRAGPSLSRTPQVQLDNISAEYGDRLDIAWDVQPDQLPMPLITRMFAAYRDQLRDLVRDPAAWRRVIDPSLAIDDGTAAVGAKLESAE